MELWQIAKPFGRPAKFKSPEELWQAFLRYCEWSTNNPLTVQNTRIQKQNTNGAKEKASVLKDEKSQYRQTVERPLSLAGFRLHAGIKRDWATFSADYAKKSADFRGVIQAIEQSVRQQMVDNALVGNYKENLVARLNGISDTIKQEHSGEITTSKNMSIAEAKQIIEEVESKI